MPGDNPKKTKVKKSLKNTKPAYIGGTPVQTRTAFWNNYPEAVHVTDSIANAYQINPALLRNRLTEEGYVDGAIIANNSAPDRSYIVNNYIYGDKAGGGFQRYGLDNVPAMINKGIVKPISENYYVGSAVNEKGQQVNPAEGRTNLDNMGLVAATLAALRAIVKKDYPNISDAELDRYTQAYYNRGIAGGRKWVKKGAKGHNLIIK